MNSGDPQGDLLRPNAVRSSSVTVEELSVRQNQLQLLFIAALAAVVIMSLFIFVFMGKQWRLVRAQVIEQRPTVQRMMADYQKTTEPLIRSFTASLQSFAAKNRDFQPILDKYHDALRPYFPPSPASAVPQP